MYELDQEDIEFAAAIAEETFIVGDVHTAVEIISQYSGKSVSYLLDIYNEWQCL